MMAIRITDDRIFTKDDQGKVHSQRDVATLFIPMTGQIQTPPPRPSR